jgi:class 3 adenylate cyclase
MVEFALDCLGAIDSFNNELDTKLEARIVVNTGCPIIDGIIENEKTTFDIIGDEINVAVRLQSTFILGKILISESFYEIILGFNYQVQKRGEIYSKWKENINICILLKTF